MPADFALLLFDEMIGMQGQEATRSLNFDVTGTPVGAAYLDLKLHDMQSVEPAVEVVLNEHCLPVLDFDPAGSDRYQRVMVPVPEDVLVRGSNSIKLRRRFYGPESADSARVLHVLVHWRV